MATSFLNKYLPIPPEIIALANIPAALLGEPYVFFDVLRTVVPGQPFPVSF